MKRHFGKGIAIGLVGLLGLAVGGAALARGHGGWHHGQWKQHVAARVDQALDAAKATQPQRAAVHAALEHVVTTVDESRQPAHLEQAVALFEADRVDAAAVARLRAEHEARMQKVGDAVVQAVTDAHDALTPEQRKAVVAWARAHHADEMGKHRGRGAGFFKHLVSARIDEALDAVQVTPEQKAKLHATRDRVFAAVERAHQQDPSARIEEALRLFEADRIDQRKVAELRAQHMAEARQLGDVFTQAITEAHDTLSAAQRKALVEWVRANHPDHGPDHGG